MRSPEPEGFTPVVGSTFTFAGAIACQVIAVRSNELLSIAWTNAGSDRPGGPVVTWLLHPEGHGTRVILRHKGFDPDDQAEQEAKRIMGRGWVKVAARLGDVLRA